MHHGMRPCLQGDESKGDDCQNDLEPFGPPLLAAEFAPPPLCRWEIPQAANPRNYCQIQQRADGRQDQHGDSDCVLMPSLCRCIDSARSRER